MRIIFVLLCILLSACQLQSISDITYPQTTATAENLSETWQPLDLGLEHRRYTAGSSILYAIRIDPKYFEFRTHYRPQMPLSIVEWQEELANAAVIVNANFFNVDNTIQGLLISDGVAYGKSYTNRGGTFFVYNGEVSIRSNIAQPYQGETFEQAVQAFPMLVLNGTQAYTNISDKAIARRTVIAQDVDGRIIILLSSILGISLYDLSEFLVNSDMNIQNALNLDGGGSSMSYVEATDNYILSFDSVPAVLAVYAK